MSRALHVDVAAIGTQDAGDTFDERRFPGAVIAHQPDDLAPTQVEADVSERLDMAVTLADVFDREERVVDHSSNRTSGFPRAMRA